MCGRIWRIGGPLQADAGTRRREPIPGRPPDVHSSGGTAEARAGRAAPAHRRHPESRPTSRQCNCSPLKSP
eukprot:scaffold1219_cov400-Prasinococcus_capsulatus_cf.AAC.27